jgi:Tfp pilus assembly protein PilF
VNSNVVLSAAKDLLFVAALATPAIAQSDSANLVALNRGYVDAFVFGRSAWYDAHLRPNFVSVSPDGSVITRLSFVNAAKQPMTYKSFGLDSVQVQVLGNLALITAITPWERADGSKGVSRYTDTWTRQNGEWKAVHAQITWIRDRVPASRQYRSPAGMEYFAQADTGAIARAEAALAADPRNVDRFIALGVAQSGARQFQEAIATFTRAMEIAPDNAMLYRWRGHRYLSVREFDKSYADLTRGLSIDSTNYGILYHLGIVNFVRGDFNRAVELFSKAQPRAPDPGELAGSTDWLWMSMMRAGMKKEAAAMLARHPDSLKTAPGYAYTQRLRLYRGEITPAQVFTPADTADVQQATLAYGVGNWYLVRGDTATAKRWFQRSVRSGGWPGFGFIMSEVELRRIK